MEIQTFVVVPSNTIMDTRLSVATINIGKWVLIDFCFLLWYLWFQSFTLREHNRALFIRGIWYYAFHSFPTMWMRNFQYAWNRGCIEWVIFQRWDSWAFPGENQSTHKSIAEEFIKQNSVVSLQSRKEYGCCTAFLTETREICRSGKATSFPWIEHSSMPLQEQTSSSFFYVFTCVQRLITG